MHLEARPRACVIINFSLWPSVSLWFKKVFSARSCIHSASSAVSFCLVAAAGRPVFSVVHFPVNISKPAPWVFHKVKL